MLGVRFIISRSISFILFSKFSISLILKGYLLIRNPNRSKMTPCVVCHIDIESQNSYFSTCPFAREVWNCATIARKNMINFTNGHSTMIISTLWSLYYQKHQFIHSTSILSFTSVIQLRYRLSLWSLDFNIYLTFNNQNDVFESVMTKVWK